jgi:Dolichyl-phosphate-mannose-protein mannosyltransferase
MRKPEIISDSAVNMGLTEQVDSVRLWRARTAFLIFGFLIIRGVIIATTKISNCEAYYYIWSHFLSWSYYDHPPLIAWITWLTTRFRHDDFAIRTGPVICSALFSWLVYLLAERIFSPKAAFFSVAILSILPAFIFVGFVLCPEAPMVPLWVLTLLLIEKMRKNDEPWRPLATGFVLGLTFLAKYTAILLVLVLLTYALTSPKFRRWLKRPSFYIGGLTSLLTAFPVIGWNLKWGWPTLQLHFVDRVAKLDFSTLWQNALHVGYVQFGAYHPFLFPTFLMTMGIAVQKSFRDDRYRFLACASIPVLIFFWFAMLRVQDSESHWPMVGYIPLALIAGAWLEELSNKKLSPFLKGYIRVCLSFSVAALFFVYAYTLSPILLKYLPDWAYDGKDNYIGELWGWEEVQTAVENAAAQLGVGTVVASSHFTLCAHLMTQLEDHPLVYCPSPHRSEFDFIGRRHPPLQAPVLYINDDRYHEDPRELMPDRHCKFLHTLTIERVRVLQHYGLYACSPVYSIQTKSQNHPNDSAISL